MSWSALARRSGVQSRQLVRTFSSSLRRSEHFLNVDTDVSNIPVDRVYDVHTSQGFDKAVSKDRAKDKVVLVDFYAEYVSTSSLV
jgi:hypothetical protein